MKTKKLLLVLSMAICAMTSWAGEDPVEVGCNPDSVYNTSDSYSSKYIYEYDAAGNKILGIYYSWANTQWIAQNKSEYEYDEQGNQTLYANYRWEDDDWEPWYKNEYEYDEQGNQILNVYYEGENGDWVLYSKNESEYDEQGNQTLRVYYRWENGDWKQQSKYRYEYEYDARGNIIVENEGSWDSSLNIWEPSPKSEYEYNAQGKLIRRISYSVSYRVGESGVYDVSYSLSSKYEYDYDAQGNRILYACYSRVSNNWDFSWSYEYEYDSEGNLIYERDYGNTTISTSLGNATLKNVLRYSTEYLYEDDGQTYSKTSKRTSFVYKQVGLGVIISGIYVSDYAVDEDATSTSVGTYYYFCPCNETYYTVTFDTQEGSRIDPVTVSSGSMVTRPADPARDGFTFGGWYKEAACTNAWDFDSDAVNADITLYAKWTEVTGNGFETSAAPLSDVYPNPTDGALTLSFATPGAYSITISDMTGKVLLRQSVGGSTFYIDISGYPAGLYLISIDDGERQSVTRIVKN